MGEHRRVKLEVEGSSPALVNFVQTKTIQVYTSTNSTDKYSGTCQLYENGMLRPPNHLLEKFQLQLRITRSDNTKSHFPLTSLNQNHEQVNYIGVHLLFWKLEDWNKYIH